MPDVQRINVYSTDAHGAVVDRCALVGRRFGGNDELDEALRGELVVEGGRITDAQRAKPEHVGLSAHSDFFVETYIPVRAAGRSEVLGRVRALQGAGRAHRGDPAQGQRQVWLAALAGALLLYLTLFWLVHSADRRIRDQRNRLIENETMSAVGELASSVAHNIRNPLASIRSSAELLVEHDQAQRTGEQAQDIVASVDRIEGWLRDLLSFSRLERAQPSRVDAGEALQGLLRLSRAGVHVRGKIQPRR